MEDLSKSTRTMARKKRPQLYLRFKAKCIKEGKTINEVIIKLIKLWTNDDIKID